MRLFKPSRAGSVVLPVFLILMCYGVTVAQQQLHDSMWVRFDDDSTEIARINGDGQIFPARSFVSGYDFQMYSDTAAECETNYHISAFRINGNRWKLWKWKGDRIVNTNAALLSFASRTIDSTLHAGDTITFFRRLKWMNSHTGIQDTNNYRSFDTLTFAVELVRSSDSARLALLDSIGIMPRVKTGVPVIHGTRPILSNVQWVVPTSMDGVRGFIRVRVRCEGSGEYDFTRRETITRINDGPLPPFWKEHLNYFGQIYGKPVVGGAEPKREDPALLRVHSVAGTSDAVTFEFATAPDGAATSIAIYDAAGRLVFCPYSVPSSSGAAERVSHRFESSGVYVACLAHGSRLVATRTITVAR